jgi:acyl-CoA thioester hydrolase
MEGFRIVVRFPIHWGEMDALGHANNTRYFVWFESARIALFRELGVTSGMGSVGPILAHTECDFLRPILYPADLVVGARVAAVGTSSVRIEHAVALADAPDRHCARGISVLVLYDYAAGQKVLVPDSLRAALAAYGAS